MRHLKNACLVVLPLFAGFGIGWGIVHEKEAPPKTEIAAPVSGATMAEAPAPTLELTPIASGEKPATPESLDDFLDGTEELKSHVPIGRTIAGMKLEGVSDEDIVAWYREAIDRKKKGRISGRSATPIESALRLLMQQIARRMPELAMEELLNGQGDLAECLAIAHPDRVPEFLRQIEDSGQRRRILWEHLFTMKGKDTEATFKLRRAYIEENGNAADLEYFDKSMGADLHRSSMQAGSLSAEEFLAVMKSEQSGDEDHQVGAAGRLALKFQSAQAALDFAAANGIDELPAKVRNRFYAHVFTKYAAEDVGAAQVWLAGLPPDTIKEALKRSFASLPWNYPEQAKEIVENADPKYLPDGIALKVALGLSHGGAENRALDWYLARTEGKNASELGSLLQNLVRSDPAAVVDYVIGSPDYFERADPDSAAGLAAKLVYHDRGNAEKILTMTQSKNGADKIAREVARGWANHDAAAVRAYISAETDPKLRLAMIDGLAKSGVGWGDSLAWVGGLEGADRDRAAQRLLLSASFDPAASAEVASEWLGAASDEVLSGKDTTKAIDAVGKALTETSPQEAGAWANALPEGTAREAGIASVSANWSSFDPVGTSEWLAPLPPSAARDTAIVNLVTNINDDPVGAFSWSLIVTDPEQRGNLLDGVVKRWGRNEPEAARAAIDSAGELTPAEKQNLLRHLDDAR